MTAEIPEHIEEARFRQALTEMRTQKGWSQGELARRMAAEGWKDFHQTTISRIEKGARPIRLGEARTIARLLDTEVGMMIAPTKQSKTLMRFWNSLAENEAYIRTARQAITGWEESRAELRGAIYELDRTDMSTLLDDPRMRYLLAARHEAEKYVAKDLNDIIQSGTNLVFGGWPEFLDQDNAEEN